MLPPAFLFFRSHGGASLFYYNRLEYSHTRSLRHNVPQYQILALQSLISSYSLSVQYLDGVKYGDTQMTALGLLGSVSFMSVSRSKPLDRLSSVRPLTSILHPALFISLLGQFAIHLTTMIVATNRAKEHLPKDIETDLHGTFKPGILNTTVFLVSSVQQVTVFVVNLQGRPFMTGVTDNKPLLWSLLSTFCLTFMFASETVPSMNRYFQLVPFPDDAMRDFVVTILVMDLVATFAFDLLMKFLFCREILYASVKSTTWSDVFKLVRAFAVIALLMYTFLANDEQWIEMERMMEEMHGNVTDEDSNVTDGIAEAAKGCVGEACEALANNVSSAMHDEF
jgi:cation-transporting ATPase 13A1